MMKGNDQGRRLRALRQFILVCAALLLGAAGAPLRAAEFHPNRIVIVPKAEKAADAANLHKQKARKVLKKFPRIKNLEVIELPAGEDVQAAIDEYIESGAVEFAEPDYLLQKFVTPNDPNFSSQYGLNSSSLFNPDINAPEAWDIRHDAPDVIVAIVDSGMRMTHEDLAANLWTNPNEIPGNNLDDDLNGYVDDVHGINAINGSGSPNDDDGHGTHIAGIIGAAGNNGKGIAGVAWKVQLMPLKFISSDGFGDTVDAIECIDYATTHGAKVINASFGNSLFSLALQSAIQSARASGVIVVCAAGNEGANNDTIPSYPANYALDNIISVAATTSSGVLDSSYSNYGLTSVDLGAPGTAILSCATNSNSSYTNMSGTSMAAPVVAGVVALMRAQFPDATIPEITQRLFATVDPVPSLAGKTVTGGKVNLQKALSPFVSAGFTVSALAGTSPLSVTFTNDSIGEIATHSWNFGDGSAISTNPNPTHVFLSEGTFNVVLTIIGTNGATATASRTINVVPTYSFSEIPYEWIDIDTNTMRRLFLADNGVSSLEIFPFNFYGQTKSQIFVGANGLLGFDSVNMATTSNADIPTTGSPNGTILPYWDNLNPASLGAVWAGTIGEAPNRKFVVSWIGVVRNSSTDTLTFQAVLHESGQIQYNYQEVRPTSTRGAGLRATVGVEDPSGLIATKYCYNGAPNRVANNQSLLFSFETKDVAKIKTASVANGFFQFELNSITGLTYAIEASPDLQNWTEIQRGLIPASGVIPFSEPAETSGNHFFRAQVLP